MGRAEKVCYRWSNSTKCRNCREGPITHVGVISPAQLMFFLPGAMGNFDPARVPADLGDAMR